VAVGAGLACFMAQWVAVTLGVPPAQLPAVWIPGGVMLAVALLTEPWRWPAMLTAAATGSTLLFLTFRLVRPNSAILLGLLAAFQTVAVAASARAVLRRPPALATLREFLEYLVVVVVGGAVLASTPLLAGTRDMGFRPATLLDWRTFALSAVLGYLTVTPTVVLMVRQAETLRRAAARRLLEAGLLALLLVLGAGLCFWTAMSRQATWTGFAMTVPPLLLWSAVRFGTLGASASLLLVSVISTFGTSRGLGPFHTLSAADNTLSLQLFVLGTGVPLLGLAVLLGEQKRAAAALQSSHLRLSELSRELIAAREEEATRIARELHDDVGQRLALVSIGLSRLRQARADPGPGPVPDIVQLQEQTSAIARSLRQVSHQLYPVALEHVGLTSALELKCEEVRQATALDVRLASHGDTSAIPRDVALCLFRVAQEAVNNVIRHSRARSIDLALRREGTALLLQVTDDGRGFPAGARDQATGLGLRSATERVRAVGGTLAVESAPGAGTTVRVAVPLREAEDAQDARHSRG
jgi:signal transduction histidine kinase